MAEYVLVVAHMFEIEPIGRANWPAGGTVAGRQGLCNPLGRPSASAHAFECADQAAHLIVQEAAGFDVEANFLALRVIEGGDIQDVQGLDRTFCLAHG